MTSKNNLQNLLEKAARLASAGMFTPAIHRYYSVLKKHPNNGEIWLQLANCLGLSGQKEEAKLIHEKLKSTQKTPDLLVRIARDLEEWNDYEEALKVWNSVLKNAERNSKYKNEALFHKSRILERMNQVNKALEEFEAAKDQQNDTWGWRWLEGRLAERLGDYGSSKTQYEKALQLSPHELQAKCSSALARLADKSNDFETAQHWLEKTVTLRRDSAKHFQSTFPLADTRFPELSNARLDDNHTSPIFLAGYPRAGTTLLARMMTERFDMNLSEEYNYLKQLVDESAFYPKEVPLKKLAKKNSKPEINAYWNAQKTTIENYTEGAALLDKNPSFSPLIPWLLCIFPKMKIIWLERDVRDLWLSSAMMDVPMNGATCWWQTFEEYQQWHASFQKIKNHYSELLPSDQFIKVQYEELVTDSESTLLKMQNSIHATNRTTNYEMSSVITSPSYVQATKPINTNRLKRWQNYLPYLSENLKNQMESL